MGTIFMEILLGFNLIKKNDSKDTKFNLEEWIKRRYSDPLRKTILKIGAKMLGNMMSGQLLISE